MTMTSEQVRIAFTIFDDPERLWGAVSALIGRGLDCAQLCLMARESTMAEACSVYLRGDRDTHRRDVAALCEEVEDWSGKGDGRIVATAGSRVVRLLRAQASNGGKAPGSVTVSRHTADLENDIAPGVVALLATSSDPKQQVITASTLLNRSLHRVTTFEFAARSAAPAKSATDSDLTDTRP